MPSSSDASSGGELLVLATPIGNLGDISKRALQALQEADRILAEDTRRARSLLSHLAIAGKRVERFDAQVESRGTGRWIERLEARERLLLLSDAGTPGVSDPGCTLVRAARAAGVRVIPIPGPSAVTTALAASGFPADRFRFFGFLPRSGGDRRRRIAEMAATAETVVFFESAKRLARSLVDLAAAMPERPAVIGRELTKLHEELIGAALGDLASRCERTWRGEITVVLGPQEQKHQRWSDERLDEAIASAQAGGERAKVIAKQLAIDSGWPSSEIYRRIHELRAAD